MNVQAKVSRYSQEFDPPVRGDTVTADRYVFGAWMAKEMKHLWPKVWHLGALVVEFEEPGDIVRHNVAKESVIMVKQEDGSIRAFYNACPHRGNRPDPGRRNQRSADRLRLSQLDLRPRRRARACRTRIISWRRWKAVST